MRTHAFIRLPNSRRCSFAFAILFSHCLANAANNEPAVASPAEPNTAQPGPVPGMTAATAQPTEPAAIEERRRNFHESCPLSGQGSNHLDAPYVPMRAKTAGQDGRPPPEVIARLEPSKLDFLSMGFDFSAATFGKPDWNWKFAFGGELGFSPHFLRSSNSFHLGILAALRRDFQHKETRAALGLQSGMGPLGLDVAPTYRTGANVPSRWGLMSRLSLSIPILLHSPELKSACCPRFRGQFNRNEKCTCGGSFHTIDLAPYLRFDTSPERSWELTGGFELKWSIGY